LPLYCVHFYPDSWCYSFLGAPGLPRQSLQARHCTSHVDAKVSPYSRYYIAVSMPPPMERHHDRVWRCPRLSWKAGVWRGASYHHVAFHLDLKVLVWVLEEEIDVSGHGKCLSFLICEVKASPGRRLLRMCKDDECKFRKRREDEVVIEGRWKCNTLSSSSCQRAFKWSGVYIRAQWLVAEFWESWPTGCYINFIIAITEMHAPEFGV
jgi:hypothetical protein